MWENENVMVVYFQFAKLIYAHSLIIHRETCSVPNYCQSVCPKQTTFEEDRELFLKFSSILCLWFVIQRRRTDNFFDWVLNTETCPYVVVVVYDNGDFCSCPPEKNSDCGVGSYCGTTICGPYGPSPCNVRDVTIFFFASFADDAVCW